MIDRIVFGVLGSICVVSGSYVIGPWYLDLRIEEDKAPLQSLFNDDHVVTIYGVLLLLVAGGLFFAALAKDTAAGYTSVVSITLLTAFLVRLYSLISIVLVLDSWRPPTYTSHAAIVIVLGAYWVWVRVNVRTPE